jgi:alpha-mannosidase
LTTYAVQEPCWTSCLPQILVSLGFTGAALRDASTAWGGYAAGFDAELVRWAGPDGSAIAMVPRYACEDLVKVYETESNSGSAEFTRKCVAHGIPHPVGMCFQDLGWPAKPRVAADYIRYVTWREYIHSIADKPSKDWRFSIEDTLTSLPWGEHTLQTVARQVRSAENRILMAEKLAALACLEAGSAWPGTQLREAWDDLLLTQAHDAWITATTRRGRQAWAFQVASDTLTSEKIANEILEDAIGSLSKSTPAVLQKPLGSQWVRVFNTLGADRTELAEVLLSTDHGTQGIRVLDAASKEVPCQIVTTRRYLSPEARAELSRKREVFPADRSTPAAGASINAATVLFRAEVPALGFASYRIEPVYNREPVAKDGMVSAQTSADGAVLLESDLYQIRLDPARGGIMTSLYAKQLSKEFCDPSSDRLMNEYRGYFIAQKQWRSNADGPAKVTIQEAGPLRAQVRITGQVGGCPFQTTVTLVEGQRRIDIQTRFTFDEDTWIGDPWDMKPEDRRSERRRSQNDGRWKLQAHFPVALKNQAIYKNAAYDVCRSRNADTFFQRWDEIKHNMIVNWVDVVDQQDKYGLAVLSDHTTAYTHGPDFPLSLVMAWGWEGGFWWGKCPLRGLQELSYGLIPHKGIWDEAEISKENTAFCEPLLTRLMEGPPAAKATRRSFVRVTGNGVGIPTLLMEDKHLLIRLFNAEGDASERSVTLAAKPSRVTLVELDGRVIRELPVESAGSGNHSVKLSIPRFGLRTLRCEFRSGTAI